MNVTDHMLQVHNHWQKQVSVKLYYQNTYLFTEQVIVCKHFILITPSQISQEFLLLASGGPGDSSHVRLSWSVSGCANGKRLVPEVIPTLYLDTNRSGPWTLKMAMRHHKNKEMFMMPIRRGRKEERICDRGIAEKEKTCRKGIENLDS